jgi:glycerol kinase
VTLKIMRRRPPETSGRVSSGYILAVDQGGSGSRAAIYAADGRMVGWGYRSVRRLTPRIGWVEQSPTAVAQSVRAAIAAALQQAGLQAGQLRAAGITSQRDTTFAWDVRSGRPIGTAITWQDLRTIPLVEQLAAHPLGGQRRQRLGQWPGPYAAAMHMAWRMEHDAAFRRAAERGYLRVSLAAGWLLQALGRPAGHWLDDSLLQAMTVYDPRRRELWHEWIAALSLPAAALPAARPTTTHFGDLLIDGHAVPVTALITDQQSALFGFDCRAAGDAAVTHGTASFVNLVVGPQAPPQQQCKTYLGWQLDGLPTYVFEADMTLTGGALQWLQQIGVLRRAQDFDRIAGSVADSGEAVFVPALAGLAVPREDRTARAGLLNVTTSTQRGHILRAFAESIGCQLHEILQTMRSEGAPLPQQPAVGGGLSRSDVVCQAQADIAGISLIRYADTETTVRGAALLAGLGAGIWPSVAALPRLSTVGATVFTPQLAADARAAVLARWDEACRRVRSFDGG